MKTARRCIRFVVGLHRLEIPTLEPRRIHLLSAGLSPARSIECSPAGPMFILDVTGSFHPAIRWSRPSPVGPVSVQGREPLAILPRHARV